jgi:hypothetical protein
MTVLTIVTACFGIASEDSEEGESEEDGIMGFSSKSGSKH